MKLIQPLLLSTALLCAGAVAFAQETTPKPIYLCTGGEGGPYATAGAMIANKSSYEYPIEVINTTGTSNNMDRAQKPPSAGGCDAFIGQPDGPAYLKKTAPSEAAKFQRVLKLHREYLQVLCSKESGITDLDQIGSTNTVAVGEQGSGAWLIWQNIEGEDEDFKDVQTTDDSDELALSAVSTNEVTCMLVPAAAPHRIVALADSEYGNDLVLAGATDWDFDDPVDIDGKPLYEWCNVNVTGYPNSFRSMFGGPKTLCWNAGLYINKDKFKGDNKKLKALLASATKARNEILNRYGK